MSLDAKPLRSSATKTQTGPDQPAIANISQTPPPGQHVSKVTPDGYKQGQSPEEYISPNVVSPIGQFGDPLSEDTFTQSHPKVSKDILGTQPTSTQPFNFQIGIGKGNKG